MCLCAGTIFQCHGHSFFTAADDDTFILSHATLQHISCVIVIVSICWFLTLFRCADIENTRFVGTIWNVIARIEGEHEPDRAVVIGNHRDAWVYGAVDPNRCVLTVIFATCSSS